MNQKLNFTRNESDKPEALLYNSKIKGQWRYGLVTKVKAGCFSEQKVRCSGRTVRIQEVSYPISIVPMT